MERRGLWTPGFFAAHAAVLPLQVGVLCLDSIPAALAFALVSRAAYAGYVSTVLRRQDRDGWFTRRWGPDAGYRRFRATATFLMDNDAVSIGLACWAGRETLPLPVPAWAAIAVGAVLCVVGVGVKAWATRALPEGAFTWKSFFVPPTESDWVATGPYRWMRNPMYTLGYLHAWGAAIALRSWPGLVAAGVAQSAILLVNLLVEKPHSERLEQHVAERGTAPAPGPSNAVR